MTGTGAEKPCWKIAEGFCLQVWGQVDPDSSHHRNHWFFQKVQIRFTGLK
jgi:hypothetical protein